MISNKVQLMLMVSVVVVVVVVVVIVLFTGLQQQEKRLEVTQDCRWRGGVKQSDTRQFGSPMESHYLH